MTKLKVLFIPLLNRKEPPVEIFYDVHESRENLQRQMDDKENGFLWFTVDNYENVNVQFGLPKEFCVSVEVIE